MLYFFHMEIHPSYAVTLNHFLSLGTLIGGVVVVAWTLYLVKIMYQKKGSTFVATLSQYVLQFGFFTTLGGMLLTLYYEYGLQYVPCDLCWYQRVFLYPQVFLFGLAWYKKDKAVLPYTLILSLAGLAVATYHHFLQMGYDLLKPCSSAPFAVDCAKPSFIEFGFVTFPFMAIVLFGFLSLCITTALHHKK